MKIKNIACSFLLLFLFTPYTQAQLEDNINIALIADRSSDLDKSPLVSLLEVELSQKDGIRLLERVAIDKILEEQQLSAAGLLDRNNAIKIGKLLRADAFVILSLENQTQESGDLIRVRLAETAHGLRLADFFEQPDGANPQQAATDVIKKIQTVTSKINQYSEGTVGLIETGD